MPESPEVAFLAQTLQAKFANKMVSEILVVGGRYKKHGAPKGLKELIGMKMHKVDKKGKVLFFDFGDICLVSRLGLTGWWYAEGDMPDWKTQQHVSVIFKFTSGKRLIFDDQLSYGTITIATKSEVDKIKAKLAPDIMDPGTVWKVIEGRVARLKDDKYIEDILTDQSKVVSGIGNYLKSEILYRCRVSPKRLVSGLTKEEWCNILRVAKQVVSHMLGILLKGKSDDYEKYMQIYNKKQDPYGNIVQVYRNASGRTTYWVPSLQR